MPDTPPNPLRRRLLLALAGALLACQPLGAGPVQARDGEDNSGQGGGGDRDDDRDDGDDDDSDDEVDADDDVDDDDDDDVDDGDDDDDDDGGGGGGNGGASTDGADRRIDDIIVRYSDGWVERIIGGRYELIDNLERRVILRAATWEDYARMAALR